MRKVLVILLVICALKLAQISVEHFEDGSGRITYCLPFSLCQD